MLSSSELQFKMADRREPFMREAALCIALLLSSASALQDKPAQPKADPFAPIRFMAGTWKGENSGQPGD
jgi:hypothetical protein